MVVLLVPDELSQIKESFVVVYLTFYALLTDNLSTLLSYVYTSTNEKLPVRYSLLVIINKCVPAIIPVTLAF